MGDSGRRQEYNAGLRAEEIYSVIEDANLGSPRTLLDTALAA